MWIGLGIVGVFAWLSFRYAQSVLGGRLSLMLIVLKVLAGLVTLAYYFWGTETGDILFYHQQAIDHAESFQWQFLLQNSDPAAQATPQGRTFFFIKLLTLVYIPLGSNLWLTSVFFSMVSFLAFVYFVDRVRNIDQNIQPASVVFFIWPSIAIWSSGISKETVMLASMLVFLGSVLSILRDKKGNWLWHALLCLVSMFLLSKLRMYVLLVMAPAMLGYLLFDYLKRLHTNWRTKSLWFAGGVVILGIVVWSMTYIDINFRPSYVLEAFTKNHDAIIARSMPDHIVVGLEKLKSGWGLVLQILIAILAGTLGPFPWEVNSWWEVPLLFETLILLVLFFTNKPLNQRLDIQVWITLLLYVVLMAALLTLSTPNYGSLSRYRLAYYPVLVFLAAFRHPILSKISFLTTPRKRVAV